MRGQLRVLSVHNRFLFGSHGWKFKAFRQRVLRSLSPIRLVRGTQFKRYTCFKSIMEAAPVHNQSSLCHEKAFSLVEILVVLAIVSILAAILFAVIGRIRENSRSGVCQNNLKQLTLALQQYAADNDSAYPNTSYQRQIAPYVKSSGWIECPTHEATSIAKTVTAPDLRSFYIYGYFYNGARLTNKAKIRGGNVFTGKHDSTLLNTATTWAFGDSPPFNGAFGAGGFAAYSGCAQNADEGFWATLHNGGANYCFNRVVVVGIAA